MEFQRDKMMLDRLNQAVRDYVEAVCKPLNTRHRKTVMVFTGDRYKPVDIITRFVNIKK